MKNQYCMKKNLLGLLCLTAIFSSKAQDYYPSNSTATPTWYYSTVVSDDNGNFHNPSTGKSGNILEDATLQFVTFENGDAYDGAFEFFVKVQDSVYTESGLTNGGVDTTGTTISLAEQLIDGYYVSKSYFFSPNEPVVRAAFKIRNPSDSTRTTQIGVFSNMGSDGATMVDTSFTDGASLVDADRWMVTTDGYSYGNGDPINSWVRFGPGTIASSPVFGEKPEASNDNYMDTFNIVIPANSYRYIFQFNRIDTTAAAARTNIVTFNSVEAMNAAGYLDGMAASDLLKVVNWNFSSLICDTSITTIEQSICEGSAYTFNGNDYTIAGSYTDTLSNVNGCDSIVTLELTVNTVNTAMTLNGDTFTAEESNATYQWIDCATNTAIDSATAQTFVPSVNGSYAVVVTVSSCSDTSDCIEINNLSVSDLSTASVENGEFKTIRSRRQFRNIKITQHRNDFIGLHLGETGKLWHFTGVNRRDDPLTQCESRIIQQLRIVEFHIVRNTGQICRIKIGNAGDDVVTAF